MDEKLKQRLVGVIVLVALAIIFLPSFFHREELIEVDRASQIPARPDIETVMIEPSQKRADMDLPPVEKLFRPEAPTLDEPSLETSKEKEPSAQASNDKTQKNKQPKENKTIAAQKPRSSSKPISPIKPKSSPGLTDKGVPAGWVVQVGSFKSAERASDLLKKLLNKKLPAYKKSIKTPQGAFVRVFVGPYIEQNRALQIKQQIDKEYQLTSNVIRFNPLAGNVK